MKADYFRQITRKTNQKRQLILSSSFRKCPKPPSPPALPVCTTSCPVSGRGGGGVRGCGFSHTTEPTHLLTNIHTLPVFTTCSGMYRLWPHFMGQTTAIFLQQIIYKKNFVYKKICKNFHNYTRLQQTIGLYNLNGIFRRNSCKYIFTFKLILVKLM